MNRRLHGRPVQTQFSLPYCLAYLGCEYCEARGGHTYGVHLQVRGCCERLSCATSVVVVLSQDISPCKSPTSLPDLPLWCTTHFRVLVLALTVTETPLGLRSVSMSRGIAISLQAAQFELVANSQCLLSFICSFSGLKCDSLWFVSYSDGVCCTSLFVVLQNSVSADVVI